MNAVRRCMVFVLWGIVNVATVASAAIPSDGGSPSERDFRREQLAYVRRLLNGEYDRAGHHDARWDELVHQFLDARAVSFANSGADVYYVQPGEMPLAEQEALARRIAATGCDDPLFLDMFGVVLRDAGRVEELREVSRRAAKAFAAGTVADGYSPALKYSSAARALDLVGPGEREDHALLSTLAFDALVEAVKQSRGTPSIERRLLFRRAEDALVAWPIERGEAFCEAIRGKGDQWLVNMLSGLWHYRAGYAARGTGWANTVTEEGWRLLHEHMAHARELYAAADALEPNLPDAAAMMISVAIADSQPGESARAWFDRAVSRQFDFLPAYSNFIQSLWPRWGGSHDEMLAFGMECAANRRYDSRVPYVLIRMLHEIASDRGTADAWDVWRRPGTFEKVRDVLTGYAEAPAATASNRTFYNSQLAGFAWQVARYEDARRAMDRAGGKIDPESVGGPRILPLRTTSGIYAMTGSHATELRAAEEGAASGGLDAAIQAYTRLAEKAAPVDKEHNWIDGRLQELRWKQAFERGETVDLLADATLIGWEVVNGSFRSANDNAVLATTDGNGAMIVCRHRFGERWELSGTIEGLPVTHFGAGGTLAHGGPLYAWMAKNNYSALFFRPSLHRIGYRLGTSRPQGFTRDSIGAKNTFAIRVWDGNVEVDVNDVTFISHRAVDQAGKRIDHRIGIGSDTTIAGHQFRISNLRIHRLSTQSGAQK